MIELDYIKRKFEDEVTKKKMNDAIGFTFDDLVNNFNMNMIHYEGKDRPGAWSTIQKVTNIKYKDLTRQQKNILHKVKISL